MTDIKKVLEENGFGVSKEDNQFFIHQFTPCGEDWGFYLDKLSDIYDYAENFDIDEEFELWVDAKKSGVSGIPSYAELIEDQQWKKDLLEKVAEEVCDDRYIRNLSSL